MIRYSPTTQAFYDERLCSEWPDDSVLVELERLEELQVAVERGLRLDVQAGRVVPVESSILDEVRARLKSSAAAKRRGIEEGGVLVEGLEIATSISDQARLTALCSSMASSGLGTIDFKSRSGWRTLSAEDVEKIAQEVSRHVQACFSAERVHCDRIAAISDEGDALTYDLSTGWPQGLGDRF